ncbi:UNVERIFIED_CONTAM: hypothetical protein Sradi_1519100 [Sesamum radiatum]|uniref:F-box/LRR-repeat protein 15/At3g58940/PEG3-like LRR domain-containing protein n=1 Tax=Sesamum radiatum TaxID=300843 RepID=A0AAW2U866_SESRA
MPSHLFTFDHLRHLYLAHVFINLPPAFKGFSRLLRLDLVNVVIAPAEFKMLISKSPMLEYIDLEDLYNHTGELEIDAPNLKSFASLFFAKGGHSQNHPWYFNHLTDLSLSLILFRYIVEVKCALCLIRSSPNLQSLKIESSTSSKADMETATQYLKTQQKHKIPLGRLKIVKISSISGLEPEMEFEKLLLLKATALRKLEFRSAYEAEEEARSNMLSNWLVSIEHHPRLRSYLEIFDIHRLNRFPW